MKNLKGLSREELESEITRVDEEITNLSRKCNNGSFSKNRAEQLESLIQKKKRVFAEIGRRNRESVNKDMGFKFFDENGMYTTKALRLIGGLS